VHASHEVLILHFIYREVGVLKRYGVGGYVGVLEAWFYFSCAARA